MIDWDAPIELSDGTPVTLVSQSTGRTGELFRVELPETARYSAHRPACPRGGCWNYTADGRWNNGCGTEYTIRNRFQITSLDQRLRTREGKEVRLLCLDAPGDHPVVALIEGGVATFTRTGRFYSADPSDAHRFDLAPDDRPVSWYCTYRINAGIDGEGKELDLTSMLYASQEEAEATLVFGEGVFEVMLTPDLSSVVSVTPVTVA